MAETGTFSALVDEVRLRSGRRDRISDIIAYARTTIRECTVRAIFAQSTEELQIVATANPHIWERPLTARLLIAIQYPYFDRRGEPVKVEQKSPGKAKSTDEYYFYLSGNSYIFSGIAIGDTIDLAYSAYAIKFPYFENTADRPAIFDDILQTWTYLDAWDDNDSLKEQARARVTNWLVFYWYDLIIEGTLAKLFKQVGDERSKTSFGLYKSQQKDLLAGEAQIFVESM